MTTITLKKMVMRNYKGATEQTTEFNPVVTTISGRNGLGKSRHADAFIWCLTGKDTQDRKDYEVKTHTATGEVLKKADASVEITLSINGKDTTFKRVFVERWETPKGQIDEVYRGNKTECYIDDVPLSATEYANRVAEIITLDTLKLVTNPYYFADIIDWKARRAILMAMVDVTNEEAAGEDINLVKLLEDMNGKSEDDYKKYVLAQIAKLKNKPEENEVRIHQIMEDMPQTYDWTALQRDIDTLEDTIELLQIRQNELGDDNAQYVAKKYELQGAISKLQSEKATIASEAQAKAMLEHTKALAEYKLLDGKKAAAEATIKGFSASVEGNAASLEKARATIASAAAEKVLLAKEYDDIKAGKSTCPTCGGAMTDELAGKLLADVTERIEKANSIIEQTQKLAEQIESSKLSMESQVAAAEKTLAELQEAKAPVMPVVDVDNLPEILVVSRQIEDAQKAYDEFVVKADTTEQDSLKKEIADKKETLTNYKVMMANRNRIAELQLRISELKKETQEIAIARAEWERKLYAYTQLQARKAELLQERVDGMFTLVHFKMFDTTIEGNLVETCVPMVNGVPYASANSASRLNAGLDIINVLSKSYGYTAPIWIDNAEGVNNIMPTESQQIRLVVTDEPTLNIR